MTKYELLAKTERILRANVFPKDEKYPWYPYRMVCPDRGYFPGIWNWDAAFHAIGFLDIDPEIAKEQILGFTSFQRESDGIFPDLIAYSDGLRNNITEMYPDNFIELHYTKPTVPNAAAVPPKHIFCPECRPSPTTTRAIRSITGAVRAG